MSTGLKANSDGSAAIQVGGTDVITLTSGGAATFVTSPTTVQAGTAAAPSITFSGDTNTGIYSPGADTVGLTAGGTLVGSVGLGTTLALQGATSQSGTGITFPNVQNASSNINTLDDYEEGTWTPVFLIGATTNTGNGAGSYTKIGRIVYWTLTFYNETWTRSGTGNITVSGFPFASAASAPGGTGGGQYVGYKFIFPNDTWLSAGGNSTVQTLFGGGGPIPGSSLSASGFLFEILSGWYIAT